MMEIDTETLVLVAGVTILVIAWFINAREL